MGFDPAHDLDVLDEHSQAGPGLENDILPLLEANGADEELDDEDLENLDFDDEDLEEEEELNFDDEEDFDDEDLDDDLDNEELD